MTVEVNLLYASAEWSIKICIAKLVFVVLVLGCNLLQTVNSLVVVVGCCSILLVQFHNPLAFSLYLTVFSLCSVELNLIVGRVYSGDKLSLSNLLTFGDVVFQNIACHFERQVYLFRCLYFSRVLHAVLTVGISYNIQLNYFCNLLVAFFFSACCEY